MASTRNSAEMAVPPTMAFEECFGDFEGAGAKARTFSSPSVGMTPQPQDVGQLPPDMLAAMYTPQPDGSVTPITPGGSKLATERELTELCEFFVPAISSNLGANGTFPNGTFPNGTFPAGAFPPGTFPPGSFPNGTFPNGNFPVNPNAFADTPPAPEGAGLGQPPRSRHRNLSDKGKQLLSELDYFHAYNNFGPMDIEDPSMGDKSSAPVSRPRVLSDKGKDLLIGAVDFDDAAFLSNETARMSMEGRDKSNVSPLFADQKDPNDMSAFLQPSEMSKQPLIMFSGGAREQYTVNTSAHVKRTRSASANNGLLVPAKQLTRKNNSNKIAVDKNSRKVAKHWSEEEDARLLQAVREYGSKNWRKIADFVETRTAEQSAQRWRKALCPEMKHVVKGKWFPHEDETLRELVAKFGIKGQWKLISRALGGTRSTKQCRERWHHHLDPALKVGNWSEAEDLILLKRHAEVGNSWAQIASALTGRTNDRVKRRFFHLQRKKKRNARVKKPKPKPKP